MHGSSTSEKSLESLCFVKDEVCHVGGVTNFSISGELISSVENAHSKCVADIKIQKDIQSKETLEQEMKKKEQGVVQTEKQKIDELELELSSQKSSLKVLKREILNFKCTSGKNTLKRKNSRSPSND